MYHILHYEQAYIGRTYIMTSISMPFPSSTTHEFAWRSASLNSPTVLARTPFTHASFAPSAALPQPTSDPAAASARAA